MGGRGSQFNDKTKIIDDLLDGLEGLKKQKAKTSFLDYGDVKKDFETNQHTNLTTALKNDNIIVCESFDHLNADVAEMNLSQIKVLASDHSNIIKTYLNLDELKIRSYAMNDVSIKTGKKTPNYSIGALFEPTTGQICINERLATTVNKMIEDNLRMQSTNFSVPVDKGKEGCHVITHEFGHFVENCIIEKRLQRDVHKYNQFRTATPFEQEAIRKNEARKITKEIATIALDKFKAARKDLISSDYGNEDNFEWFAETFAEANLHITKKPLVKAMQEFLKREGDLK